MENNVVDTKRAHRELIVNEHIEAESIRHDVTATVKTFKHPRYEVPALGVVADGAEAVNGLLGALLTAFPDFHIERTALHHADDAVIVECRLEGTQQGEWVGIEPHGKKMEVPAALIFLFDDEELICERAYFDHATFVRQLPEQLCTWPRELRTLLPAPRFVSMAVTRSDEIYLPPTKSGPHGFD